MSKNNEKQSKRWENKYNNKNDYNMFVEKPKFPKCINIEISDICNYDCVFCASSKFIEKNGLIDDELAVRLINEAYENGTREICFHINGEPLTNPRMEKYVELAKKLGYTYIFMTTNGALANLDRMKRLVEAGIDSIRFSINSLADKYKLIHGGGSYELVIKNLNDLVDFVKENNKKVIVGISVVETKYTSEDCKKIRKKFRKLVDDITVFKVNDDAGQCELNRKLMNENSEGLSSVKEIPCPIPFNSCYITRNGYLTICCGDKRNYMAVADLNKTSLVEAWNNDLATEFRKRMIEGKINASLCYNCIFNKNEKVNPLNEEYAKKYISKEYDYDREKRINELRLL